MIINFDLIKYYIDKINQQEIENKELKRDNIALLAALSMAAVMVFFYAAWN